MSSANVNDNDKNASTRRQEEEARASSYPREVGGPTMEVSSRMDKDPLGIGVPLPVLVRRPIRQQRPTTRRHEEDEDEGEDVQKEEEDALERKKSSSNASAKGACRTSEAALKEESEVSAPEAALQVASEVDTADDMAKLQLSQHRSLYSSPGAFGVEGIGRAGGDGDAAAAANQSGDIEAPPLNATVSGASAGSLGMLDASMRHDDLVEAELVSEEEPVEAKPVGHSPMRWKLGLAAFVILLLLGVIVLLAVILPQQSSDDGLSEEDASAQADVTPRQPILERILERRKLRCGNTMDLTSLLASFAQIGEVLGVKNYTAPISDNFTENLVSHFCRGRGTYCKCHSVCHLIYCSSSCDAPI